MGQASRSHFQEKDQEFHFGHIKIAVQLCAVVHMGLELKAKKVR